MDAMHSISIRAAGAADIEAIADIYADAVVNGTASYELEPPSAGEMAARHEALLAQGLPYLVAEADGIVAGYAYAGLFRPRPAYRFTLEDSVYLAPGAQGRGIGRRLLAALIGEAERLGYRQMVAVIGDGARQQASIRLHEALGFAHAGTIAGTGYKHGRWLDTIFMQLALNGGTSSPPDPRSWPERQFREGA